MKNLTHKSIHILQPHEPTRKPKLQKEYAFHQPKKNCIKKISFPSKNFKTLTHNPTTDKYNMTITAEMKRHTHLTDKNRQVLTTCKRNCLKKLCVDKKVLSLQYASARRRQSV